MRAFSFLLLLVALVACKKEEPAKPAPVAAQPAAAPAPPPAPAPSPTAAAPSPAPAAAVDPKNPFQALQQLGEALAGQKGAGGSVVNWRSLEPFVPEKLGDWTADGQVDGSTGGMGAMQVSRVKRSYQQGERRMRAEIIDTTASPLMRAGFAFVGALHEDTSRGIKKGTKVGGHNAILEWNRSSKRSRVTVLVADRFLVKISVDNANPDDAANVAAQMNLTGLAAVK
jgi:hypothetical protein